jgi:hypothetical protein
MRGGSCVSLAPGNRPRDILLDCGRSAQLQRRINTRETAWHKSEWLGGEGKIEISKASDILIEPQYENDARVKEIASQLTEEISGYPATTSLLRGHPCLIGTRKLNSRKMSAAG